MIDSHDSIQLTKEVPLELGQKRFDQIAAQLFSDYSRSRIQQWIKDGELTVNGQVVRPRDKLIGGELLTLNTTLAPDERWEAQPIALDVVYQDDHIIVLNKPVGLVVHPGAGTPDGTVLNGLLHAFPELASIPRAGIVHRLDKDTSGLMVVARTLPAQTSLAAQLQDRSMGREYYAVCMGVMTGGGKVDEPINRHPTQRTKMAVSPTGVGKDAVTHYRVEERFTNHTLVRCKLETGRTHQIRVHLSYIGYPLVGDALYAGRSRLPKGVDHEVMKKLKQFNRQALHAGYLELIHPESGELVSWESPIPDDMAELITILREDAARNVVEDDY